MDSAVDRDDAVHLDDLETYLCCPRRYGFERSPLAGADGQGGPDRSEFLRAVVCAGLRRALAEDRTLEAAALDVLESRWAGYADERGYHSDHQRLFDYAMLRGGVDDVCSHHLDRDGVGAARSVLDRPVVGPDLALEVDVRGRTYRFGVDCLLVGDGHLDAVRLTDEMRAIGVPYPSTDVFEKYFDEGQFRPRALARLFESYLAWEWLATATAGTPLEPGTLHYVAGIENRYRAGDGVTVRGERRAIDPDRQREAAPIRDRLETVADLLRTDGTDPAALFSAEGFDVHSLADVLDSECEACPYRAGCEVRIRKVVSFDG